MSAFASSKKQRTSEHVPFASRERADAFMFVLVLLSHHESIGGRLLLLPQAARDGLALCHLSRQDTSRGVPSQGRHRSKVCACVQRVAGASSLQPSGRAAWHDTQIRHTLDPPLPPLRGLQVSRRVRRAQEDDGPKLVDTHVDKLRLRLMHYVTEYGVHPSCIMDMDETATKLLGLGHRGWATPKQDGRVRFIGAAHKRNLTISTVVTMTGTTMAQLIVEGTTKRVAQDLPQHKKLSYTFSESHWCTESTRQELIEWLGAWV